MNTEALALLHRLGAYWEARACLHYRSASGQRGPILSARFLADIALGDLARCLYGEAHEAVEALRRIPVFLHRIAQQQDSSGAFRWNLPDPGATHPQGVRDQVDLAMVVDTLCKLISADLLSRDDRNLATRLCLKAAAYLVTAKAPGHPGVILKRHYERPLHPQHPLKLLPDVLNGDAMAARALHLVSRLPGGASYCEAATPFLEHLIHRFGGQAPGWWPYSEALSDHHTAAPALNIPTVFFQSMMIIHLRPMQEEFPSLRPVIASATRSVARGLRPDGEVISDYESRQECRLTPNALIADALRIDFPELAHARLQWIAQHHLAADGSVRYRDGTPMEDKWRIWLYSDLARLLLTPLPPLCAAAPSTVAASFTS